MIGIIVSDFENVIKKTGAITEDVRQDIRKVNASCSSLNKCLTGCLDDLKSKINSDLQQFSKIDSKITCCNKFLSGVFWAYQKQDEDISYSLK